MSAAPAVAHRSFRRLHKGDLPRVMEIERSAYRQCWTEGIFHDCLRVGYECWAILEATEIVGYGIVSIGAAEAHLLNLCVTPARQGCGLGRELLHYLIGWASDHGALAMYLEVRLSNIRAQSLYRVFGFREIGRRNGYYPADAFLVREDALLFRLDLVGEGI
ncbi:Ribosomal-protein-alanine acetyltransferase [mine drainage metagenome]|uniref:Ribosomal-protein-alanine acetyltransferase n=1 Tax=mine drainage metagenome TaxID=410659 RepID=T1A9U5_9ZZZZ